MNSSKPPVLGQGTSAEKPVKYNSKFSKKKTIILSAVALVLLAIIAIIAFILSTPKTIENRLYESDTFTLVEGATTVDEVAPSTIIIAPSTQEWWANLLSYSSSSTLSEFDYSLVEKNSVYISYTNSKGGQYESFDSVGMSTTIIIYKTAADAIAAGAAVGNAYPYEVRSNMLLLIPQGAYSDIDYALEQYNKSKFNINNTDLELDNKAMMQINFDDFADSYTKDMSDIDITTFTETMKMFGIEKGNESGWSGTSSDGMNWNGKFVNVDTSKISKPSEVIKYLSQQIAIEKTDGTYVFGTESTIQEDEQTGVYELRQSVLVNYMAISTTDETAGSLYSAESQTPEPSTKLKTDEGLLKVEFNVNPWLAFMKSEITSYPVTGFDTATILVTDTDGSSTISFTPLVIAEQ